jgi:peptide/nickel transport system substrate-binding protein
MTRRQLTHTRLWLTVAAAGVLAAGLAACGSSSPSSSSKTSPATTLVMESSPETSITQTFNPYVSTGAPYGMGATGLIYEPLIQFDLAKAPTYYPFLATGFSWSNNYQSITFTIRTGVKWNNGTPFTPADVAFTYNLMMKYPDINSAGLTMTSVTTSGDTVTLNFPTSQYGNIENIAGVDLEHGGRPREVHGR